MLVMALTVETLHEQQKGVTAEHSQPAAGGAPGNWYFYIREIIPLNPLAPALQRRIKQDMLLSLLPHPLQGIN